MPKSTEHLVWTLLFGLGWMGTVHAQLNETFEKETVGRFPASWDTWRGGNESAFPREIMVIDHLPGQSPGAKALMVGHDGLTDQWGVRRDFEGLELDVARTTEWGLRFSVQSLPKSKRDSPGFLICLQGVRGPLPFAGFRVLTQDEGRRWMLFNPNYPQNGGGAIIAKDLSLDTWHTLRFVISVKSDEALGGEVKWIFDGETVNTETLSKIPVESLYPDSVIIRPVIVPPIFGPARVLVTSLYARAIKPGKTSSSCR